MIKNKPIIKQGPRWDEKADCFCPKCLSKNVEVTGHVMTLLSSHNHHTHEVNCKDCSTKFEWEHKRNWSDEIHHWFWVVKGGDTATRIVTHGIPNCCEASYLLVCECDGYIRKYATELDGHTETRVARWNGREKLYREFYQCNSCDYNEEIK